MPQMRLFPDEEYWGRRIRPQTSPPPSADCDGCRKAQPHRLLRFYKPRYPVGILEVSVLTYTSAVYLQNLLQRRQIIPQISVSATKKAYSARNSAEGIQGVFRSLRSPIEIKLHGVEVLNFLLEGVPLRY